MNKNIHIVELDDWVYVYIDDKLVFENHHLDAYDILSLLNIDATFDKVGDEDVMEEIDDNKDNHYKVRQIISKYYIDLFKG